MVDVFLGICAAVAIFFIVGMIVPKPRRYWNAVNHGGNAHQRRKSRRRAKLAAT